MKKYILLLIAACQGLAMMAQTPSYKMKVTLKNGQKLVALTDEVEELAFGRVGKVKVDITERYKTSTSLAVNLNVDVNASRIKAVCVPASQTVADPKAYVEEHATVDYKNGSYKKSFDFLTPETDYIVYALAYDVNGLPSEVSQLQLTTGKAADDPFTVETKNVGTTRLDYTVTPKDASVKYFTICESVEKYQQDCDEGSNAGDLVEHFISMWKQFAQWYGGTWQENMVYDMRQGTYDTEADNNTSKHLLWNADHVIVNFGMNAAGELVTPIQLTPVKTKAPKASDIKIKLTVKRNAWRDVAITAEVSNDDTYLVNVQPASLVGDRKGYELQKWLLYEGNTDLTDYAKSGSQDWEFTPSKGGQKYCAIAFGMDGGAPSTEPVIIEFDLPEGGF